MTVRKRRPRAQTREIILNEAHAFVREQGLPEAIGFRLNDALEALGLTTGAAYNIWESQDEFRHDLALRIAQTIDWAEPDVIGAQLDTLPTNVDFDEYCRSVGDLYFAFFSERPEYYLALYFWSVTDPSDELAEGLTNGYQVIYDTICVLAQRVLDEFDRELVEPYDLSSVAVAATAALEGMAVRRRVDEAALVTDRGSLFGECFASIMATATGWMGAAAA